MLYLVSTVQRCGSTWLDAMVAGALEVSSRASSCGEDGAGYSDGPR